MPVRLCGAAAFLLMIGLQKPCEAKQAIMPSIPQGIHLRYSVTSQELALPPEYIEQKLSNATKLQDATLEQRLRRIEMRAVNGPIKTFTAEYWGTMRSSMYAGFNGSDCVTYDGRKVAVGAASDMVPDLIKQPSATRSGMVIAKGSSLVDDRVYYLGIYQPGKTLFDDRVILSETTPLATGGKRVYRLPSTNFSWVLHYDKAGRPTSITAYAQGKTRSVVLEGYQFADYATVDGITYPREVVRKKMTWYRPKGGKLTQLLDKQVVFRVINASAGPIPHSSFALSASRPATQIEDHRYQIPGSNQEGITYQYSNPALSIDEASERAYQTILSRTQPKRQGAITLIKLGCLALIALVGGRLLVAFLRKKKQLQA